VPATRDLTTPAGRAMAGLLAVFAEFAREFRREERYNETQ
jgi:DNA invertase Pin-like site-specific DNA recombinase